MARFWGISPSALILSIPHVEPDWAAITAEMKRIRKLEIAAGGRLPAGIAFPPRNADQTILQEA